MIPTLIYRSEAWTLYVRDLRKLERFLQSKLRSMLDIKWEERITNEEVLVGANIPSIESIVMKQRLRWLGLLRRMEDHRLSKQFLNGELQRGSQRRGAPKKLFKDQCKRSLLDAGIDPVMWEDEALERSDWRGRIHSGVVQFEINRASDREGKKEQMLLDQPLRSFATYVPECSMQE